MNEIALKLQNKAMKKFRPLAEQLIKEGKDREEIVSAFQMVMRRKVSDYYSHDLETIRNLKRGILRDIKKADSKTETIFYRLLIKNKIGFIFQYPIGKYRVDFLLGESIVLELDGSQHNKARDEIRDQYMKKLGL